MLKNDDSKEKVPIKLTTTDIFGEVLEIDVAKNSQILHDF